MRLIFFFLLVSFCAFSQKTPATLISENDATTYSAPFRIRNAFNDHILSKVNKRTPEFMDSLDITKIIRFYLSGSHPTATQYNVTWPNKSGTVAFLDDVLTEVKAGNGIESAGDSIYLVGGTIQYNSGYINRYDDDNYVEFNTSGGYHQRRGQVGANYIFIDETPTVALWNFDGTEYMSIRPAEFNVGSTSIVFSSIPDDDDGLGSILLRNSSGTLTKVGIGTGLSVSGGNLNASGSSGDVSKVGTPADNQVGVWTGDGTIEGTSGLTYNGSTLGVTGAVTATGAVTGSNLSGTNTGDQTITLTGDVTGSGTGSFATTIAAGAVDIPMLSATGTADSMSVLYGNNTWRVPSTPLITVSGTTLTLDNTYNGKIINATNASGLTITVPTGLANHFSCGVWRASGAGDVSLSASGTTLNGLGLTLTSEETALSLIQQGQTNDFIVVGAVGGNNISADTVTTSIVRNNGPIILSDQDAANNPSIFQIGDSNMNEEAFITIGNYLQALNILPDSSTTTVTINGRPAIKLPSDSDSGADLLLRDATTGMIEKLGIGSGLSVSGGNLVASGGSNRAMTLNLHSNATSNITLTNQPNSEQFLNNSNRNIWLVDFTGYDSVKISFRTITGSASANSPRIKLEYATTFGSATTDYSPIGTGATEVSAAISTTNALTNSGWVALTAAAKGEVYIALMQDGGDGVADPAIASITLTVK